MILEGKRVLVVEDEPLVRATARRALERLGCSVLVAGDAAEAFATTEAEEIDLILTDLTLPDLDGLDLAAQLRRDRPGLPVVLMSGRGRSAVVADPRAADRLFIEKPFSLGVLQATLVEAVESSFEPV